MLLANAAAQGALPTKQGDEMDARKRAVVYAAFLGLTLGSVQADYAPLKVGNRWAYEGSFSIPAVSPNRNQVEARERLTLEVLSQRQSGDTSLYRIKMRDSLFARKWRAASMNALRDQPDTILSQVLTYASLRDSVFQVPAAIDSGALGDSNIFELPGSHFSVFRSTLLLIAHRTLSGQPQTVPGSDPSKRAFATLHSLSSYAQWSDWYVDDVGAFFEQFLINTQCARILTRNLYLAQFNGKEVSIGVTPPGSPLGKEGMIACSAMRDPSFRSHVGILRGGARVEADLSGRIFRVP